MILVKLHFNHEGQKILALCDADLIGKKFEEGKKQLDLTGDFYRGEEKSEKEIRALLNGVYIINLVGEKSLALMKKLKLNPETILKIKNIPHAEILLIRD